MAEKTVLNALEQASLKDLVQAIFDRSTRWNKCAVGEKHHYPKDRFISDPRVTEGLSQEEYQLGLDFADTASELYLLYQRIQDFGVDT